MRAPEMSELNKVLRGQPALAACGLALLFIIAPLLLTYTLETRTVLDTNVWLKPIKFALSLALYTLTLSWFASYLSDEFTQNRRFVLLTKVVVACIVLEMVWLVYASSIGEPSHFNQHHPVLKIVYFIMGLLATALTFITLIMAFGFRRMAGSALTGATRVSVMLGLALTFMLTMITAWYMAGNPGQTHTVLPANVLNSGSSNSGAIVFFGWSTSYGDLRVPHFFATHAMHAIPVIGWLSSKTLPRRTGITLVWICALAYIAFVAFVFYLALNAQPFIPIR